MQDGKPFFYLTPATNSGAAGARLTLTSKTTASASTTTSRTTVTASTTSGQQLIRDPIVKDLATHVKSTVQKQSIANGKTEPEEETEAEDPYKVQELIQMRKEQRLAALKRMAMINRRRTDATPIYGEDCREAIQRCMQATRSLKRSTWQTRGYANCCTAMAHRNGWSLNHLLKSFEERCADLKPVFANFVIYVPSVCAPRIRRYVQNLSSTHWQHEQRIENIVDQALRPKLALLHPIISEMTTKFPDPRLIQYDCGKLQTMDRLLRQLKVNGHRVLIFTQMTKMLDVLEAFLNYHGHIYLRLDGSTRVEQRQILMERFNGDKRIFCFILSTRSGGVGINLTGADTVIFYDSDWNPTMDAQAQDRCHRIGQTRDVHIYRLVSERTIEVNILKKANQKRMLSDMAIEGGNFTTTYFKSSTIKDLFTMEQSEQDESSQEKSENKDRIVATTTLSDTPSTVVETEKQSLRAFEHALAAAEDEQDVQATKTAKAEVAADLAEFDENIPIATEDPNAEGGPQVELSKADLEMQNLVKQLSPIERYAMRFVEETGAAWTAEQLRAAEAELEAQKREWEANRLAAMHKEEELLKQETEAEEMLTYSRKDSSNQVNTKTDSNSNKRRLVRENRRNSAQKLSRSVSSHSTGSNNKNSKSATTRGNSQNSLNQTVPVGSGISRVNRTGAGVSSSSRGKSNSTKSTGKGTDAAPQVRRQTRLHSLGAVNMASARTPPTRKTTRTALAASAAASTLEDASLIVEERPKRQSANIAMSKMMKTPFKQNVPSNISIKTTPPKRGRRDSVAAAATRSKLLERRATIAAPLKHMDDESDQDEEEQEEQESEEDTEGEEANATVDDDEEGEEELASLDEETIQTGSQTNDEEDDDEEEVGEEGMVDIDTEDSEADVKSSSTYGTAADGKPEEAESLDGWDAHDQVQDTTMTSSTYYNVSEESDTDEHHDSKAEAKEPPQNSDKSDESEAVGHTPRTRSRGTVKINLWTLDVSPVANALNKSSANRSLKKAPRTESTPKESQSEPRRKITQPKLPKKEETNNKSNSNIGTLHRWISKSPRVMLRSTPVTAASASSSAAVSGVSGGNASSSGTAR
nr:LD32234p [Drosophila melanogaster]